MTWPSCNLQNDKFKNLKKMFYFCNWTLKKQEVKSRIMLVVEQAVFCNFRQSCRRLDIILMIGLKLCAVTNNVKKLEDVDGVNRRCEWPEQLSASL